MIVKENVMSKQKVIDKLIEDPLMPLRHSAEHVLQTAVESLYPGSKKVMGPPIEDGFYGDFDLPDKLSADDMEKIERRMQEIVDADLPLKIREVTLKEAKAIFAQNPYKLEFVQELEEKGDKITVCELGSDDDKFHDLDLCMGHHVSSTGKIGAYKLLSIAGAYWRGDEKNKMLTRIYGTAFDKQEDLDEHLKKLDLQRQNDHRRLNNILDIYATSDLVGKGLIMYTPRGTIIRNELRDHLLKICKKYGAQQVDIPHMAKIELYEKSGHADKFKDELFRVISHYDEEFVLKPVNCPHHTQIYASRMRSYRDLPIAYVESTQQHRDEKPGSIMGGLNRARSFEIDDGHTFCTPEQVKEESAKLVRVIREFYQALGMWGNHWVSLSFRDPATPEKYIGTNEDWENAQKLLQEIDREEKLGGQAMIGEAALYGPKIDIMMKDAVGNDRQLGTVQIDFAMPKRFGLTYVDKDGSEKTPVMIHRAILGSYHRFIAYLMESLGGAFPVWLAPIQIEIIPISTKHQDYAGKIKEMIENEDLRGEINIKDSTMGAKIREAQQMKIPYMFIVGDEEVQNKTISVRTREGEQFTNQQVEKVLDKIRNLYLTKSLKLW